LSQTYRDNLPFRLISCAKLWRSQCLPIFTKPWSCKTTPVSINTLFHQNTLLESRARQQPLKIIFSKKERNARSYFEKTWLRRRILGREHRVECCWRTMDSAIELKTKHSKKFAQKFFPTYSRLLIVFNAYLIMMCVHQEHSLLPGTIV
jgi:hypothetical protein